MTGMSRLNLGRLEQKPKGDIPATSSGDATGRQSQLSLISWVVRLQFGMLAQFKLVTRTTPGNCNYPRSHGSLDEGRVATAAFVSTG